MKQDTEDVPSECEREDCNEDAVGIYEGVVPPASTIRYAACPDDAPDTPPVRSLKEGSK